LSLTPRDHRLGIAGMVACTVLWSIAGVVTRLTDVTDGFEVTFWRSAACIGCVALWLLARDGAGAFARIRAGGWPGLASGLLWAIMFTCFMLALTRTTVANVLVVSSLQPFFAAIAARVFLDERVPARTWIAMAVAFGGIVLMFADALGGGAVSGALLALCVPLAAAANVILLKRWGDRVDFVPAVMIGAILSALAMLPLAWPLEASARDATLLSLLGAVQLALPCVFLAAWVVKRLSAAEVTLLALLEVLLGPLWVWAAFGERPSDLALVGGALVLVALAANEVLGLRRERQAAARAASPTSATS
jgi:drug/metabolite transporter (DMT)-like permease